RRQPVRRHRAVVGEGVDVVAGRRRDVHPHAVVAAGRRALEPAPPPALEERARRRLSAHSSAADPPPPTAWRRGRAARRPPPSPDGVATRPTVPTAATAARGDGDSRGAPAAIRSNTESACATTWSML